ncbi:hypothetical protein [Brevundimonas sp.]|uniref:hypothetical protein n=1 Tax=Brevundimonas sp. TaxID=1871086 RepID=UPI003F6ED3B9
MRSDGRVQPLLARFAVPRSKAPAIQGRFCEAMDLWVVDTPEGPRPLVLLEGAGDTTTGTFVQAEADDTDLGAGLMLGTSTFTKVGGEGDDTDVSASALLEITTKTDAQVERDDVATRIAAMDPRHDPDRALSRSIH